ncbi:TPA: DUF4338 domain-containing protein [Pseudomonas aeruginosa]|nr:DUF4338 domain-containing protein [Pseudomonas aeruginosa]
MKKGKVIRIALREARLKRLVRRHLKKLGFERDAQGRLQPPNLDKEAYRKFHQGQREDKLEANRIWLSKHESKLAKWFADGASIVPSAIAPELELVKGGTWQANLFRLASLYWQVPVSEGYGRRLRFLVWDRGHNKLLGIFALGDAVFNQAARDAFIGWDHHRRSDSLVNLMDAYVLGALPPLQPFARWQASSVVDSHSGSGGCLRCPLWRLSRAHLKAKEETPTTSSDDFFSSWALFFI